MIAPKQKEQLCLMGAACNVKYYYAIEYAGILIVRRIHRLLPFKRHWDSKKKKGIPASVPAIITGFGYGWNGKWHKGGELTERKRIDYILVRIKPNGKEYKVPAKHCTLGKTGETNDSTKKQ